MTRVFYLFDKLRIDENVHDAAEVIQRGGRLDPLELIHIGAKVKLTSLSDGFIEKPI